MTLLKHSFIRYVPNFIRRNPIALSIWRIFRDPHFDAITQRLSATLPKWQEQTIVQIGVNDGQRDDPISALLHNRGRWRALLVEPLPEYFGRLVKNYGLSSRFMFEQSAVGLENGQLPFYHIDERAQQSPHWRDYFDRIGSLNRSDLIINLGDCADAMAPYIVETKVNVLSINSLLKKWRIEHINALIIDAEGYDWQILKQVIDLGIRPKVVMFEHSHLNPADRDLALTAMQGDYSIEQFNQDYFCILRSDRLESACL